MNHKFCSRIFVFFFQSDTYHHKQSLHLQYFEIQDVSLNPVKNNKVSISFSGNPTKSRQYAI